jgi:hypothetical protein
MPARKPPGKMSEGGLLKVMVSDLVPNGMLPLAAALAAFGAPPGVGLALLAATALASWWTLGLLATLHEAHGDPSSGASGAHRLLGSKGERAVEAMIAGLCFWNCVSYVDFALDLVGPSVLGHAAYLEGWGRWGLCTLVVWVALYPLCCLPDLSHLQPFSAFAVWASASVVVLVAVRALDGQSSSSSSSSTEAGFFAQPATAAGAGEGLTAVALDSGLGAALAVAGGGRGDGGGGSTHHRSLLGSIFGGASPDSAPREAGESFGSPLEPLVLGMGLVRTGLVALAAGCRFVAVLSVGFLSHYNAADYYHALADPSPRKFGRVR